MKRPNLALLLLLTFSAAGTIGCGATSPSKPVNPTFTQVAFWSGRAGSDSGGMYVMNMDGTAQTLVPFTSTDDYVYGPSISADSSVISFTSDDELWTSNVSGSTQAQLPVTGTEAYVARMSPDAQHIVSSQYLNNNYNLFVTNVDGTDPVNLTTTFPTGMTDCYSASFSADSTKIVFECEGASLYGLYTIALDGTGLTTVYTEPAFYMDTPAFSPDGKTIFFIQCAGEYTVDSIPVTGGDPVVLITAPTSIFELEVFNSNIYYTRYEATSEYYRIYQAALDGTGSVAITDATANNYLYNYTY